MKRKPLNSNSKKQPLVLRKGFQENKEKNFDSEVFKKTKIKIIGIGGGGGNIVAEIADSLRKVSFVIANTDLQALKNYKKNILRFPFGEKFTKGLGTGMNTELAKEAALAEKEKIKKLFLGQDLCILISSLGAGTGSGAAPVFANVAKNLGVLTIGVFTLPFKFEGEKKEEIAKDSLQKLRQSLNALIVLPNDRIFQVINKNASLKEAFSAINKNLADSLEGLVETIFSPGLINIDFADLRTILEGEGKFAYLNSAKFENKEKMFEGIKKLLNSPLYFYNIQSAKRILFNVVGEKELSLEDVSLISKTISEQAHPEAKIIFGVSQAKGKKNKIKVTVFATGCNVKNFFDNNTKKEKQTRENVGKINERKKEKEQKKRKLKIKVRKKETVKPNNNLPETQDDKKEERIEIKPISFNNLNNGFSEREKIRKNALQIKKELEELEKEFLEKEKFWEKPAFLRKQERV